MTTHAPLAIEATGLEKSFGDTRAVAGVDLAVPEGAIYGVLGPNGAGKTTCISCICGLLRPTAGRVSVMGHDTAHDSRRARESLVDWQGTARIACDSSGSAR